MTIKCYPSSGTLYQMVLLHHSEESKIRFHILYLGTFPGAISLLIFGIFEYFYCCLIKEWLYNCLVSLVKILDPLILGSVIVVYSQVLP